MTEKSKYKLLSPISAGESEDLLKEKTSEDALRRVQALLADWLRMENVVVLAAAGCSVGAGGRLMAGSKANNLECHVLDAVEKCRLSPSAAAVLQHRKATWPTEEGKGPRGFEDWLSYLFNASALTRSDHSPLKEVKWKGGVHTGEMLTLTDCDITELCALIQKAIYAECALKIDLGELLDKGENQSSGHIPFLAKLIARDTNLGRTHLFTLNYDTLFEQAMEELGIQYFDGFSGKSNSRFDPAMYGLDIYYPGDVSEGRVRRFDKFLQFYKLHGSLHWYLGEDGMYRARHCDFSFVGDYRKISADEKARKISSEFSTIRSFGILPMSQKFTQTLDGIYAHLFRLFHARINHPQTFLLVVGYGFNDEHVTRIIETALMNPLLVMLVVEPNPESEVIKRMRRYQSLGQRAFVLTERLEEDETCSYEVATFADFAKNVMPDVRWLEDYKRLRAFEEQIRKIEGEKPEAPKGTV